MRIPHLTTFFIILLSGLFAVTATAQIQHGPRQDVQPMDFLRVRELQETTATTDDVPKPTTTTTRATTTDNEHTKTSTTEMTSTTSTTAPTTTALNETSASNNEKTDKLPLEPSLTPAMGVGGFILIALGAVLAGIGSRHLRIQVFLTTGFLASLGVTVLIIYVMSPPATNAIQGAYLVAVFFSGLSFGALAIVFKELAEGLGCLLGGFCFSMWLMTLKPGGLLTETGSRIGFIAALTVVGYAVSFSRYTRKYGLMVSTAFSGGTALVLGVDCFSRAGLKEFWLYIWDLNDKTFPENTSTYPINRNIRVELAVTVIVTLMGVISQLRLWKIIRQHFRGNTKDHHADNEKKRHNDTELEAAREFEENIIRERAEWEARYDVGIPQAQNRAIAKSISIQELPVDEHEIHEKEAGSESTANCNGADSSEQYQHCEGRRTREANRETFYFTSETESQTSGESPHDREPGLAPTANQTQFPLFNVVAAASMDHGHEHDDIQSTASAVIGSEMDAMRSAARSRTPLGQQWPPAQNKPIVCDKDSGASIWSDKHEDRKSMTERDITEQVPEEPKPEGNGQGENNPTGTGTQSHSETDEPNPKRTSLNEDTIKDLPQRASRIVQSFRTNEWAKHLDDAEIPEPPPIRPIEEDQPKIPVEGSGKQPVAPVNVKELLQTPLNAQPPPAVERKQQQHSPPRGSHELQSKHPNAPTLPQPPPAAAKEHDSKSLRPKWKGPPPLLAVREDLVRYKPSSTCVSTDPWLRFRHNPRNLNPIHPARARSIPGEEEKDAEADDVPLSQRRAMLQAQSAPDTGTPPTAISRSITSPDTRENPHHEHAIMAAWRNSVHEDLQGRRNPLGPIVSNSASGGPGSLSLPGPAERTSSASRASFPTTSPFAFGQSPRDRTSAMALHIENKIATAMQKGDMHDLHREAIRQLQASATRRA